MNNLSKEEKYNINKQNYNKWQEKRFVDRVIDKKIDRKYFFDLDEEQAHKILGDSEFRILSFLKANYKIIF